MRPAWGPGGRDLIRPGLERIREALERSGHPERTFRAVHIAGTNGKGSTACFTEAILAGILPRPVGLYTSPHLLSPTERIRVSGRPIPASALGRAMREASRLSEEVAGKVGDPLSFFEAMTWVAFDWFRRKKVPLAVLETGLGGRWDATSTCLPEACVITNIGLEHREWLGGTLPAIAFEKAGILREKVPAILGPLRSSARRVVVRRARELRCPVWEAGADFSWEEDARGRITVRLPGGVAVPNVRPGLAGRFQSANAALACAAAFRSACLRGISADRFRRAAREGLAEARLPGRFSRIPGRRRPGILVDGAHNPDAASVLAAELGRRGANARTIALWSMLREKDAAGFVRALSCSFHGWVAYPMPQERAADPAALASALREGRVEWKEAGSFAQGWEIARGWAGPRGRVVVCGSLMAAGDAYRHVAGGLP